MAKSSSALLSLGINVNRRYTHTHTHTHTRGGESIKVRRTDQKTVEAPLVFSVMTTKTTTTTRSSKRKAEETRNMEFRLEGRRRRSLVRVNSFRDHSRISLHSPEYSRRLDCHASFSTFPRLAISLLRRGWEPVEGWLVVHRVTVSTRNKNNSVPGREIKKKKKKERKMSGRKRKSGKLPKLPKPLDNGEDIFSNEPRRVHSSANYTSTTFSVFLLFYS